MSKQTQQNQAPSHSDSSNTNNGTVTSQLEQTSSHSGFSLNPTSYFNEATGSGEAHVNFDEVSCDNESTLNDGNAARHPAVMDDNQFETESSVGSSCSRSSSNEMEESCLLGIDVCNEKTTVGLVLRVLADTAIRLDGDG